ncbi:abortive phage infection protein [Bacillus toyonensis]|uniref:AIPR family protein n=1 Tax=Bacillus toyonensis TaxID=155322 RepID=UPI0002EB0B60|nr:AIPR family protein [Bacillus toyonensis]PEJ62414.1 abortive phage infection protein [Bacillus toyonensis]PGB31886.1 abortive phage infection protein [Bacillus toyonensis]PHG54325.1 abortive phage infection protein [Bacillus toyonensis]PKR92791.1 DNA repair protein [Bacillus cereus Rock4-18]
MTIFKIPAVQFKKLEDPLGRSTKRKYVCYVHINDVPEQIPMATNPREQKLTTSVAKQIETSLTSNDGDFHVKNRGIVISAAKVVYNTKKGEMDLILDDEYEHGNIDGGHTYKIVLNHKNSGLDQYVQFEIMVGVEEIIEPLAAARNTSVQVDDKSLAELSNKFAPVKDAIGGMPFYDRIAFKQNQQAEIDGKKAKMIDAREIVAIISMFDKQHYVEDNHPTHAYSSKAKVLDNYLGKPDYYEVFSNIATDIFDLYDEIERDFPYAYNKSGGRYGAKKYAGYKEKDGNPITIAKAKFSDEPLCYKVPDGLMYPLLASFRALIGHDKETNKYFWKKDPIHVYKNMRENLATKIMKYTDAIGNNPNTTGKDANAWDIIYMTVERALID